MVGWLRDRIGLEEGPDGGKKVGNGGWKQTEKGGAEDRDAPAPRPTSQPHIQLRSSSTEESADEDSAPSQLPSTYMSFWGSLNLHRNRSQPQFYHKGYRSIKSGSVTQSIHALTLLLQNTSPSWAISETPPRPRPAWESPVFVGVPFCRRS